MTDSIGAEKLKEFSPFGEIESASVIEDILRKAKVESVPDGHIIFKRGESDDSSYWLMEGTIDLLDENFDVVALRAGSTKAKSAFNNESLHSVTAISTTESVIFKLKTSFLELVQKLSASNNYMVSDLGDGSESGSDWMSSMLSSPLFDFIPPASIQELFRSFEDVDVEKGDVVITQGEPGDYFYVIANGKAVVEYNTGARLIQLAELEPGAFFGEDALISNVPRNATITMLSAGELKRLSAEDFHSLLYAPVIERVSMEEAQDMILTADPLTWILDVRTKFEYQGDMLDDSINVPLLSLRKDLAKLDRNSVYVARSKGDKRCELAAYILNENGFTAYVLNESAEE